MKKHNLCKADIDLLLQYGLQQADCLDAVCLSYEPGEYVLQGGGPIDYLYFVTSGKAKVCLGISSGKQLILCYFVSNGIIGDLELMSGMHEAYSTVQAVSKLTCIGLPLSVYGSSLKANNVFVNCIGKELSEKLIRTGMNSAITILHPLEARLCAYVLQVSDGGVFREKQTEVAELVGTSYRHLLRCLDRLCKEGVLLKIPDGYRIVDRQELNHRAGDLYAF